MSPGQGDTVVMRVSHNNVSLKVLVTILCDASVTQVYTVLRDTSVTQQYYVTPVLLDCIA